MSRTQPFSVSLGSGGAELAQRGGTLANPYDGAPNPFPLDDA